LSSWAALSGVALLCVGCDQATKRLAAQSLRGAAPRSYLGDFFRLTYAENQGAFLGLGNDWPNALRWLAFTFAAVLVVVVSIVWIVRHLVRDAERINQRALWGMLLIAAGGVGNLIDRIVREGRVIDFMVMSVGPLHTGVFNVADVHIMVGLGLLLIGRTEAPRTAAQS
jgi:signal peptidase II